MREEARRLVKEKQWIKDDIAIPVPIANAQSRAGHVRGGIVSDEPRVQDSI